MNDYGKYLHFDIENIMSDYEYVINESHMITIKELWDEYNKLTLSDWFEDKPIVEKSIPKFNFA